MLAPRALLSRLSSLAVLAVLAVLTSGAASCAAPLQNGGVEMRPGAEERLDMICRYRTGSGATQICAGPAEGEE